jgi:hypothetical protein
VSSDLSGRENGAYDGTDNVKFCVKLQKSAIETLEMLKQVYDESGLRRRNVFKWRKCVREGREHVNGDEM